MSPRVLFEPIGEEIDCDAEETVLDASFRAGYNLVYGCREGQCSACKCYLLEGEVVLKPYSTFALSDSEETNGYTLMCRAMPEEDLVVELLHFDPDNYRLENPIRDGRATVTEVESLTHDIRRLVLDVTEPADFSFIPGQYVDLWIPDSDARRSFSMANVPGDGQIELIIKRYEGGRFSSMLDGAITAGDELQFTGPYGAFHLREADRPALMVAGGSGMAPILSLLRRLSERAHRSHGALLLRRAHAAATSSISTWSRSWGRRSPTSSSCPCCRTRRQRSSRPVSCTRRSTATSRPARCPSRRSTCAGRRR